MKKIFTGLMLASVFAGCELDNYEMPNLTLSGKIMDSMTGELVESGGINGGTIVQLYEYNETQPQNLATYPDGTFINSRVFAGDYTYTAVGAFNLVNSERVPLTVTANTQIELKVIPHVRVKVKEVTVNGTTATVKVEFEKINNGQQLTRVGVAWNTYQNPNILSVGEGKFKEEHVDAPDLKTGERTYTMEGLVAGATYYIRAFSRTDNPGNYYNYSTQVTQKIN